MKSARRDGDARSMSKTSNAIPCIFSILTNHIVPYNHSLPLSRQYRLKGITLYWHIVYLELYFSCTGIEGGWIFLPILYYRW